MAQRCITTLAHRDRQYSESRPHRKILMLVRLFSPARRLMMNAFRGRHIKHLPMPVQPKTKTNTPTRKAPFKNRCDPANRHKRLAPQCARAATDPLARHRLFNRRRKSVWQRGTDQLAGLKSLESTM